MVTRQFRRLTSPNKPLDRPPKCVTVVPLGDVRDREHTAPLPSAVARKYLPIGAAALLLLGEPFDRGEVPTNGAILQSIGYEGEQSTDRIGGP
ncbi:MAG: hypothetical protein QOE62_3345 [Actinomycetota bacterium]|nr:hypothetical protein [Actinomycetota bacterium]